VLESLTEVVDSCSRDPQSTEAGVGIPFKTPMFLHFDTLLWWGSAPSPTATEEPSVPASSKSYRAKCKHAKATDAQEVADKLEQNLIFLEETVFFEKSSYSGERIVVFCPTGMQHVARESIEGKVLYRPKVLPC